MPPTQPNRPEQYVFSHVEEKAILRIIRRVIDHSGSKDIPTRNHIFALTKKLLRICHSRACTLDLKGMANAPDLQLVLDDLTVLRERMDREKGYLPHGSRLNFALNVVYRRERTAA